MIFCNYWKEKNNYLSIQYGFPFESFLYCSSLGTSSLHDDCSMSSFLIIKVKHHIIIEESLIWRCYQSTRWCELTNKRYVHQCSENQFTNQTYFDNYILVSKSLFMYVKRYPDAELFWSIYCRSQDMKWTLSLWWYRKNRCLYV